MRLTIDKERAATVVDRLREAYSTRWGILKDLDDLVENQIPPGILPLSEDHARFLLYIVSNDHGVKSRTLYERAKLLFVQKPALFCPEHVLSVYRGPEDQQLIADTVARLGVRYPREAAKSWYYNSMRLADQFHSSALRLFTGTHDALVLYKSIRSFRSYGAKTGGMLVRAIGGLGFAHLSNLESVLMPVDIHDSRISFYTGIVTDSDNPAGLSPEYHTHIADIQNVLSDACRFAGIEWPDVDRALWLIGSRGCVSKRCVACPLCDLCAVGRSLVSTTASRTICNQHPTV